MIHTEADVDSVAEPLVQVGKGRSIQRSWKDSNVAGGRAEQRKYEIFINEKAIHHGTRMVLSAAGSQLLPRAACKRCAGILNETPFLFCTVSSSFNSLPILLQG